MLESVSELTWRSAERNNVASDSECLEITYLMTEIYSWSMIDAFLIKVSHRFWLLSPASEKRRQTQTAIEEEIKFPRPTLFLGQ